MNMKNLINITMTTKFQQLHYEEVAALLHRQRQIIIEYGAKLHPEEPYHLHLTSMQQMWENIRADFEATFKRDNPKFNKDKFRAACIGSVRRNSREQDEAC